MFATSCISQIIGLRSDQLIGKSFYYCIAENCLPDAVKCLESAKANDSIAYLRFRFRNPLQGESTREPSMDIVSSEDGEDDDDGGVPLRNGLRSHSSVEMADPSPSNDGTPVPRANGSRSLPRTNDSSPQVDGELESEEDHRSRQPHDGLPRGSLQQLSDDIVSRTAQADGHQSGMNGHVTQAEHNACNHRSSVATSSDSSTSSGDRVFDRPAGLQRNESMSTPGEEVDDGIELEAVVSCSSDGLVVILRRAKPLVPSTVGATETSSSENGVFASPWALDPVMPPSTQESTGPADVTYPASPPPAEAGFMDAIRDVAVFAWSLTGIHGGLTQYARGKPSGESLPPGGLPVWDPNANLGPESDRYNGFSGGTHRPVDGMGEPVLVKHDEQSSSEDEVLWKRVPTMPAFRRPKRRPHSDAFDNDGEHPEPRDVDGRDAQSRRRKLDGEHKASSSSSR